MKIFAMIRDLLFALFIGILIPTTLHYGYEIFYPMPKRAAFWQKEAEPIQQKLNQNSEEISKAQRITERLMSVPGSDQSAQKQLRDLQMQIEDLRQESKELEKTIAPYREIADRNYDNALWKRHLGIFYSSLAISVILIIIALYIPFAFLSAAFILGALITMIKGYAVHGWYMSNVWIFNVLLLVLILMIYIAIRFMYKKEK